MAPKRRFDEDDAYHQSDSGTDSDSYPESAEDSTPDTSVSSLRRSSAVTSVSNNRRTSAVTTHGSHSESARNSTSITIHDSDSESADDSTPDTSLSSLPKSSASPPPEDDLLEDDLLEDDLLEDDLLADEEQCQSEVEEGLDDDEWEDIERTPGSILVLNDIKKRSNPAYWALLHLYCAAFYALTQSGTPAPQYGQGGFFTTRMHRWIASWPSIDHSVMVIIAHLPMSVQDILVNQDTPEMKLRAIRKLNIQVSHQGAGVYIAIVHHLLLHLWAGYTGSSLIDLLRRTGDHIARIKNGKDMSLALYRLVAEDEDWDSDVLTISEYDPPYDSPYWVLFTEAVCMLHLVTYDLDMKRRVNPGDNPRIRAWAGETVERAYALIGAQFEAPSHSLNRALPTNQGVRIPMSCIPLTCENENCDIRFPRDKKQWTRDNRPHPVAFGEGLSKYVCIRCYVASRNGKERTKAIVDRYHRNKALGIPPTRKLLLGDLCFGCDGELLLRDNYAIELEPSHETITVCRPCYDHVNKHGIMPIRPEALEDANFNCDNCEEARTPPVVGVKTGKIYQGHPWVIEDGRLLCLPCWIAKEESGGRTAFLRGYKSSSTAAPTVLFSPQIFLKGGGQPSASGTLSSSRRFRLHEYLVAHGDPSPRTWPAIFDALGLMPPSREFLQAKAKKTEEMRARLTEGKKLGARRRRSKAKAASATSPGPVSKRGRSPLHTPKEAKEKIHKSQGPEPGKKATGKPAEHATGKPAKKARKQASKGSDSEWEE